METKSVKIPGPEHPIAIKPNPARITVSVAGRIIADTREALTLQEASYPAVHYIPRKDIDMSLLERTDHKTYCPYKGDCAYYSIPLAFSAANWTPIPRQIDHRFHGKSATRSSVNWTVIPLQTGQFETA